MDYFLNLKKRNDNSCILSAGLRPSLKEKGEIIDRSLFMETKEGSGESCPS